MANKYLEGKIDTIQAIIAGVGAAGYMLGSAGYNWNNAARDDAFKEVDKIMHQVWKKASSKSAQK